MTAWYKKCGKEIELNDSPATVAKAESLGWSNKKPTKKKQEAK